MKSHIGSILKGIENILLICYCIVVITIAVLSIKYDIKINVDRTFSLSNSAFIFIISLIEFYGFYFLDWGDEHFNKWNNSRFKFLVWPDNQKAYVLLMKIMIVFVMALCLFLFLYEISHPSASTVYKNY